jgi:trans-aconitate methyltransferase
MPDTEKPDHWSATKYAAAANFVPLLTTKVVQYLDPQPGDRILDIGCGDGQLTQTIASKIASSGGHVLGLDASPSFIQTARAQNAHSNTCAYELQDCTDLSKAPSLNTEEEEKKFDKIFSNAALHWILRSPPTRKSLFHSLHSLLKQDGTLVFEMGGAGNVAEFHTAFTAALSTHGGLSLADARAASPWFFPSVDWMRGALEEAGFKVEVCESEYRPTRVTDDGGLEAWVRLMGAAFLDAVTGDGAEEKKEKVVRAVCEWVEGSVFREERDGSRWIGYVRLRAMGRKR